MFGYTAFAFSQNPDTTQESTTTTTSQYRNFKRMSGSESDSGRTSRSESNSSRTMNYNPRKAGSKSSITVPRKWGPGVSVLQYLAEGNIKGKIARKGGTPASIKYLPDKDNEKSSRKEMSGAREIKRGQTEIRHGPVGSESRRKAR